MATLRNSYNNGINLRWLVRTVLENNFLSNQSLITCETFSRIILMWGTDLWDQLSDLESNSGTKIKLKIILNILGSWLSFQSLHARQVSLVTAHEKDTKWLNMLNTRQNAMEWDGFNSQEAHNDQAQKKPANTCIFGPLIDAKASHPDTVLASLEYLKKSLANMGMSYVHISIDLRL